jgi:cell division protein FtsI (penicillin-binding protein 3)
MFWRAADRKPAGGGRKARAAVRSVNYATSPLLASKTPPWRSRFVVGLVGLAFLGLVGRAFYIQVVGTDFYQKQGERRFTHTLQVPASRGRVLDRNGLVLATSVQVPSIWAIPREVVASPAQKRQLASLLEMKPAELDERLESNPKFAWLRRQVDEAVGQQVKALGLKGIYEEREYKRHYPEGESAAHVVGFTNVEEVGQEGVELRFQALLQGQHGSRSVLRDRLGRSVEDFGEPVAPVNGQDVQLAVDSKVQFFAWQRLRDTVAAHGARGGSVVVLDVLTGEVLALANYPSYNPAQRRNLSGEQLRNRALTDIFEPGSTMKPFIAALALEKHGYTPTTPVQTAPGSITITGSTIRDAHPHGLLSLAEVIQKSSNVGTVRMAMQMPAREMWELYTQVGFGQKPQIDFPGAVTGRLRPHKTWRPIEQATMSLWLRPVGQPVPAGARLHGVRARRRAAAGVPAAPRRAGHRRARALARDGARGARMLQMAAGPGGTAPKAQALGYSVGGKTGTARKQEGKGYTNKYRAWFVGLAPVSQPRIVVAVMVDEPSRGQFYGGDIAAPVFSQVVQQTLRMLGVPPDLDVKAQIVAKPAAAEQESF